MEGTATVRHNGFTLGLVSDNDELSERYTQTLARYLDDWTDTDVGHLVELLARLRTSFGDCRSRAPHEPCTTQPLSSGRAMAARSSGPNQGWAIGMRGTGNSDDGRGQTTAALRRHSMRRRRPSRRGVEARKPSIRSALSVLPIRRVTRLRSSGTNSGLR